MSPKKIKTKKFSLYDFDMVSMSCMPPHNLFRLRKESFRKQVIRVESAYHSAVEAQKLYYLSIWSPHFEKCKDKEEIWCKPTHQHEEGDGKYYWMAYRFTNEPEMGWTIRYDWKPKTDNPKHLELGTRYYELDERRNSLFSRIAIIGEILEKRILDFLWETRKPKRSGSDIGKVANLDINGRMYVYIISGSGGYPHWQRLGWPEDNVETICLKSTAHE